MLFLLSHHIEQFVEFETKNLKLLTGTFSTKNLWRDAQDGSPEQKFNAREQSVSVNNTCRFEESKL
tara:strand:- start:975 stop:1172 length:198 start_codon:yes stop_codon:yes gene_type:complete